MEINFTGYSTLWTKSQWTVGRGLSNLMCFYLFCTEVQIEDIFPMYGGHVIVMNNDMTNYLIENSLVRLNSYFCHGER